MKSHRNQYNLLPSYEGYAPGTEKYQVFLKLKTQEEYQNLSLMDDQHILVKSTTDRRVSKKEQREKVFQFTRIFRSKLSNEDLYRELFPNFIQRFLQGISQTILLLGPRKSGKTSTAFGNLRDPGLVLYFFQDLFNFIEDRFFDDHITIKLSVFEYHPKHGFRDLLITKDFEFHPHALPLGDNQLLGIPEIIVDNFLLAMKVVRIALSNLQNLEQNLETELFQERMRETSLIVEVKAEIAPTDDIREQVILSKVRFVKTHDEQEERKVDHSFIGGMGLITKILSETCQKGRKTVPVPFRMNPLTDFLRDSLTTHSQVMMICCIGNQDYQDTLKVGNFAFTVLSNAALIQFSIFQWNNQLKDLIENEKDSVGLFAKDFQNMDSTKTARGKIIFQILNFLQETMVRILDLLESKSELTYTLNCLYSQILSAHCSKYQNIITTEDAKEFYLAKIELYSIEQLYNYKESVNSFLLGSLSDLYEKQTEIINQKNSLMKYSLAISQQKYPELTQFDIQRLNNTTKLLVKLLNLFIATASQNIFNQSDARESMGYIFQDANTVGQKYTEQPEDLIADPKDSQLSKYDSILKNTQQSIIQQRSSLQSDRSINKNTTSPPQKKNTRTKTSVFEYDDENDLIGKLFTDKNTRDYHAEMVVDQPKTFFQTQVQKPITLLNNRRNSPAEEKINFFQEVRGKCVSQTADMKVNPNLIKQMMNELKLNRNLRKTGVDFMRKSYMNFTEMQKKVRKPLPLARLSKPPSPEQKSIAEPYRAEHKYSIVTTSTQFKLPKLNLKEQQFKKFFIQ